MNLRNLALTLAFAFGAVTALGVGLAATRAAAVFNQIAETGTPGYLKLAVDSDTQLFADLNPGDSATWLIQASLHDAASSTLSVEVQGQGAMIEHSNMRVTLISCSGTFQGANAGASCSGTSQTLLNDQPLGQVIQSGQLIGLSTLIDGQPRELLVTLAIPASTPVALFEGEHATIGIGVHASGNDAPPVVTPPGQHSAQPHDLAATGTDAFALGMLALGLIGLALALSLLRTTNARGRVTTAPFSGRSTQAAPATEAAPTTEADTDTEINTNTGVLRA